MSITTPPGFAAAGWAAGIKSSGALDLALLCTDDGRPVPTAATFTLNKAAAAPVQVSRSHLATSAGRMVGVVVSSGNANAATGANNNAKAATDAIEMRFTGGPPMGVERFRVAFGPFVHRVSACTKSAPDSPSTEKRRFCRSI